MKGELTNSIIPSAPESEVLLEQLSFLPEGRN